MKRYMIDDTSYFFDPSDPSTTSKMERYKEGVSAFISDQEIWYPEKIRIKYGGEIVLLGSDDKEVATIDYPYYTLLRKAGYIVYKDYDKQRCSEFNEGCELRQKLKQKIIETINSVLTEKNINFKNSSSVPGKWYAKTDNYNYIILVENIDKVVEKNIKRKDNNLKYYPYDKNMDKYGTLYLSIFSTKNSDNKEMSQYKEPNEFIANLMKLLGPDYHFTAVAVKAKILYND